MNDPYLIQNPRRPGVDFRNIFDFSLFNFSEVPRIYTYEKLNFDGNCKNFQNIKSYELFIIYTLNSH